MAGFRSNVIKKLSQLIFFPAFEGKSWDFYKVHIVNINWIDCLKTGINNGILAATWKSVFYSTNNDKKWDNISNCLSFNDEGYVFAN